MSNQKGNFDPSLGGFVVCAILFGCAFVAAWELVGWLWRIVRPILKAAL